MVSTTTTIVNGQTHTVTKITDENGTRVIEDYGNRQQRITVNGREVNEEKTKPPEQQHHETLLPQSQNQRQIPYQQQSSPYSQQSPMEHNNQIPTSNGRSFTSGKCFSFFEVSAQISNHLSLYV